MSDRTVCKAPIAPDEVRILEETLPSSTYRPQVSGDLHIRQWWPGFATGIFLLAIVGGGLAALRGTEQLLDFWPMYLGIAIVTVGLCAAFAAPPRRHPSKGDAAAIMHPPRP